jgi:Polyketide cyclase / dehydrase and lipid transport
MMVRVETRHVFPMPADALWAMIGDFGNTGKWSGRPPEACIRSGEGIGSLRTLTLADGQVIVDRLDAEGPISYTYSIVTAPLPVAAYTATMSVVPIDGQRCEFCWSGAIEPKGIDDAQAIALFENVYRSGIAMMERAIAARA